MKLKTALIAAALAAASTTTTMQAQDTNPFFKPYDTPDGVIPFDKIKTEHYEPAIERGIALGLAEVDAIVANPQAPTFQNTIVALERSGKDLERVTMAFDQILSVLSDDEIMAISDRTTPKLSDYATSISLNEGLWERVKSVYDQRQNLNLNTEDSMLLDQTYKSFARNGALLQGADREKYRQLSSRLADLTNKFGQNVLKEMNTYEIWLGKDDLAGLPESSVEAAALAAEQKGRKGEYLFTLDQPVYSAFMQYSDRDDLRKKMYMLNTSRNTKGQYDNTQIMRDIAQTRLEISKLLGYGTYADYALEETMAGNKDAVYSLLTQLRDAYRPALDQELKELAEFAGTEITPWNYSYYSNKLKNARYSYNEEEVRPYFELENVTQGVFGLANKLYGITFTEDATIPVYHPDVKAYKVNDADGSYLGVLYTDFFPRASKRPGAWMTNFRPETHYDGEAEQRPHIPIVMNFTKPTADKPALLTPYEVSTFLHEFGHSLHGMLAKTKYGSLSGTGVRRDFVELPSQFNENYLAEPEFLKGFAKHYKTGEPIPQELIDKIRRSKQFGAAYRCMRQLNFGFIDMAWHTVTDSVADPYGFEAQALSTVAIFPMAQGTAMSPQFSHIFSGGYASGYYSYKWAEVLDADAFAKFQENGIFDPATAKSFRDNILSQGGTKDPAKIYRAFRGQEPTIDALLHRDGITYPKPLKTDKKLDKIKDR